FSILHSNFPTLQNYFPGNCRSLKFTTFPKPGFRLENHTVRTIDVVNEDLCMFQCYLEPNCISYNFCEIKQLSGKHECDLNNATIDHDEDLVKNESYIYRGAENACKKNPCKNNATCQAGFTDRDYQCLCVDGSGFKGHDCDEGKESYTFISIANHMISNEIWDKSARVIGQTYLKGISTIQSLASQ
ncbi:unnamed protein product, partial [Pocillopora meandrina]